MATAKKPGVCAQVWKELDRLHQRKPVPSLGTLCLSAFVGSGMLIILVLNTMLGDVQTAYMVGRLSVL